MRILPRYYCTIPNLSLNLTNYGNFTYPQSNYVYLYIFISISQFISLIVILFLSLFLLSQVLNLSSFTIKLSTFSPLSFIHTYTHTIFLTYQQIIYTHPPFLSISLSLSYTYRQTQPLSFFL